MKPSKASLVIASESSGQGHWKEVHIVEIVLLKHFTTQYLLPEEQRDISYLLLDKVK